MQDDPSPVWVPRWRGRGDGACLWAGGPCQFAVFHRPSGKTHFVNGATRHLLTVILREPMSAPEAAQRLARLEGAEADPDLAARVADVLQRLEELGLVDRC